MFNDNPIIIDVNSRSRRNRKQKILCVLCKVQLECINPEENRYKCPRCKNTYQLGYEIIPTEDILESSHEEEGEGEDSIGLLSANEDEFNNNKEEEDSTGSIPVPKYFKDSATVKVIDYHEE